MFYRTFSDNDTATQPLFGEIAADAGKRQKFADNALHFMRQYGELEQVRYGQVFHRYSMPSYTELHSRL